MKSLLSIVIANYNYGRFLEEAIRSVVGQDGFDQCELIIVDGGSTDNSVEIIRKYSDKIAWWCSEKDKGQSDAFNKGFAHARGRFLTWLNADDVMLPRVVQALKVASRRHPACEWFVGGCFWLDPQMRIVKCNVARPFSELRYRSGIVNVCGPSSFFTKRLLDAVDGVDVRLCYTMDMKLWFQFRHDCGIRYRRFIEFAWGLRIHGLAKTSGQAFVDGCVDLSKINSLGDGRRAETNQHEFELRIGDFPVVPLTRFRRVVSIHWPTALKGLALSRKWRGRYYLDFYKRG